MVSVCAPIVAAINTEQNSLTAAFRIFASVKTCRFPDQGPAQGYRLLPWNRRNNQSNPASSLARMNTRRNISLVSLPVLVFCSEG